MTPVRREDAAPARDDSATPVPAAESGSTPSVADYLAAADAMLRGAGSAGADAVDGGWWPHACACLIRLALESGLDAFWRRVNPAVGASRAQRAKILMLRRYVDPDAAHRVGYAWATLSRLTHHHVGESSPTAAELRHLYVGVTDVLACLAPR